MNNDLDFAILKVLLTNKKYALEFVHECNEKLFDSSFWRFAKLVIDYIRIYKEVPTKRVLIEKVKDLKNEVYLEYVINLVSKLEAFKYDDREYKHDLEKLKQRFSEKLINNFKSNLNTDIINVKSSLNEMTSVLTNIKSINQPKAYEQKTLKESIEDFDHRFAAKLNDPHFGAGIATGYSFFDFTTGGLRPGEMLLIGADTGGGKSIALMNMAINMWMGGNTINMDKDYREGNDILYFSLEMPHADCFERMISRLSMVPQKNIRDAKLTAEEAGKLNTALQFIKKYPWDLDIVDVPRGASIETIELIYNDVLQKRRKPAVVIIDYLTLMDYHSKDGDLDDWLKQGKISEVLHEFCRVNELVLLSAVQLNDPKSNSSKSSDSQIGLHRIGRSKMIMHNANFGMQIEKRPKEEDYPDMTLHLIKSRRTELAKGKVFKNFACCAMLNDEYMPKNSNDVDDISEKMEI
jgi:KaiC/GvpD/RAD55 family RecA-like ATPase